MKSQNQVVPLDVRVKITYMNKNGFCFNFENGTCKKNYLILSIESLEFMTYCDMDKFIFLANHGFQFVPDAKAFIMNHTIAFSEDFIKEKSLLKIVTAYGEMMQGMNIQ